MLLAKKRSLYGDLFGLEPNRAFIGWALARSGRTERALADFLYEDRYELSFGEELHLLRTMLENGRVGTEPNNLYKDLLSSGKKGQFEDDASTRVNRR